MRGHVRLAKGRLQLLAGAPEGRDQVNQIVATWPGWKRLPAAVSLPGGGPHCSLYQARVWESTILPLFSQTQIEVEWADGVKGQLTTILLALECAQVELDPPPSHHAPLPWDDEWARKPMPHQVMAIRAIKAMGYRVLLADDMGLGKTATSIWAWQQSGAPRALIICPKTVKRNWQREIWATLKEVSVFLIDGTPKQRSNVISELDSHLRVEGFGREMDSSLPRQAVIINYDLLHRLPERELEILKSWCNGQFLICDESHYIKNRKAERSKIVLQQLAPPDGGAQARLMLTGTPVRNTLEDLWTQIQAIRPGTWSSFHQFDKFHLAHSVMEIDTGKRRHDGTAIIKKSDKVRGAKDVEKLNAVVNTLQVRRKKEDVLDLPPKIFTYPDFDLDPPTAKIYRAMKDFALIELAELDENTPIFHPQAKSAMEAMLRCEQIAQGFLGGIPENYLEVVTPLISKIGQKIPGRQGHLIFPKSAKIEWLSETIDSIIKQGGRPVIFSRFNTPMFWLVEQWTDAAMLHGGLSMPQRDTILDNFQKGGIPVLFCQVKIAEGWNATASQDCIFYGRDWSPAVNSQAADRLHRIGQTGTVNVQIPIVAKTFEVYLDKKLKAKEADAEQALRHITVGELREAL